MIVSYRLRKRHFASDLIYDKIESRIEFADKKGKVAHHFLKHYVTNLRKKISFGKLDIRSDGYLSNVQTHNATFEWMNSKNGPQNSILVKILVDRRNLIDKTVLVATTSLIFNDSFNDPKEYIEIECDQYTRTYQLEMIFHEKRPAKNFLCLKKNKEGSYKQYGRGKVIESVSFGRQIVSLIINGFPRKEILRLEWDW